MTAGLTSVKNKSRRDSKHSKMVNMVKWDHVAHYKECPTVERNMKLIAEYQEALPPTTPMIKGKVRLKSKSMERLTKEFRILGKPGTSLG